MTMGGRFMSKKAGYRETSHKAPLDTLRLTNAQWRECLNDIKMHRAHASATYGDQRQHERYPCYDALHMLIYLERGDGSRQLFNVRTYDISVEGIGFLHGTYLHPESRVQVYLKHRNDGWVLIEASVMRCEHFKDRIHLIGLMFDEPITITDYLFDGPGLHSECALAVES